MANIDADTQRILDEMESTVQSVPTKTEKHTQSEKKEGGLSAFLRKHIIGEVEEKIEPPTVAKEPPNPIPSRVSSLDNSTFNKEDTKSDVQFETLYQKANILTGLFGIEKFAAIVTSDRVIKQASATRIVIIETTLEASGTTLEEPIRDALNRLAILDNYEDSLKRNSEEIIKANNLLIADKKQELEIAIKNINAEIEAAESLSNNVRSEALSFCGRVQQEYKRFHDLINPYIPPGVSNPIGQRYQEKESKIKTLEVKETI